MSKYFWSMAILAGSFVTGCVPGNDDPDHTSSQSSSAQSSSVASGGNGNLQISEVVAKADNDYFLAGNDWIELRNTGQSAVSLSQYSLADDKQEPQPLPDVVVQPGQYVIVAAVDEEEPLTDGSPYVPFKLGSEDSVFLYQNGQVMDQISWLDGDAKSGRSYGRLNGVLQTLYPTPDEGNAPYTLFTDEEVFSVKIEMSQADWEAFLANAQQEEWYPVDMVFNGIRVNNVGFRTKGQSSLSMMDSVPEDHPTAHRYGFKIDFNRYLDDQKFMGMKMLVLGNGFADPTMMRDVISYRLFKDAGVPSPRTSFVDLWVAGEHLGVYSLIEPIDGEFVERYFEDDNDSDLKGDLYKGEVLNRLIWEGDDIGAYTGLELKTNEETIGTPEEGAALLRFLDTLNNSDTPLKHVDTDLMVRYFAALALTGNTDSYLGFSANNFYLYEHRSIDAFAMLPWDFNLGLGVVGSTLQDPGVPITNEFKLGTEAGFGGGFGFGGGGGGGSFGGGGGGGFSFGPRCDTVVHLIDTPINASDSRPLITALLDDPQLRQQYRQHIEFLINGPFHPDAVREEVMRLADLIDPYVQNDPTKFFTYTEWRHNLTNDMPSDSNVQGGRGGNFFGPATGLLRFIEDRVNNVRRQLNGEIPSSSSAGTACPQ